MTIDAYVCHVLDSDVLMLVLVLALDEVVAVVVAGDGMLMDVNVVVLEVVVVHVVMVLLVRKCVVIVLVVVVVNVMLLEVVIMDVQCAMQHDTRHT